MKSAETLPPIPGYSFISDDQTTIFTARGGRWLGPCLLGTFLLSMAMADGETAVEAWVQPYGSGSGFAGAVGVAVDGSGNVFVTGTWDYNYATIKYSSAGVPLWTNRYNTPLDADDYASAIAVDSSGNVFVTGFSRGSGTSDDYATIKYSGAGVPLWTNRYDGPIFEQDRASAIAVDSSGNVFVTGTSIGISDDYATIKYSGAGVPLWINRYNGPAYGSDAASAIAVDSSGNVVVTGYSIGSGTSHDYATIKYSSAGVPLWTNRYNGPANDSDGASAIAVDASDNVFVTGGSVGNGSSLDYATVKYSGTGVPLWTNRYNGPGNGDDRARAIAVDSSGNVHVTGESTGNGTYYDYATIKYSGAGVPLWTNRYNGPTNAYDSPSAIAVDSAGNVFVTGTPGTIKYSGAGVPLWTNRYGGGVAIGPDGAAYVAALASYFHNPETGTTYSYSVTVKYVTLPELAVQPLVAGASNVNLTLSGAPNSVWTIERAVALPGPWTNLGSVTISSNGSVPFQDASPPKPAAFYRSRQ